MLSKENTELLCRVGAGTVMGDMMRQYWLPCVYSWELTPMATHSACGCWART